MEKMKRTKHNTEPTLANAGKALIRVLNINRKLLARLINLNNLPIRNDLFII